MRGTRFYLDLDRAPCFETILAHRGLCANPMRGHVHQGNRSWTLLRNHHKKRYPMRTPLCAGPGRLGASAPGGPGGLGAGGPGQTPPSSIQPPSSHTPPFYQPKQAPMLRLTAMLALPAPPLSLLPDRDSCFEKGISKRTKGTAKTDVS